MNVQSLFNLNGKLALVSGGAGRYGKCIVEGLAEAGAAVIIASRNGEQLEAVQKELAVQHHEIHVMTLDQGDHQSVLALRQQIKKNFGKLDIFVNNAVSRPMTNYFAPISQFEESMRVNATGMMDILREMAELIVEKKEGGSIINISSMMGMFGPDLSNYEGTDMPIDPAPDYYFHNAGIINITRYMARMYAGKNMRVNCISPGGLYSKLHPRFLENYCSKVPLGRMANADDIKGPVVLLASQAGAYINGENILMDGGMHA